METQHVQEFTEEKLIKSLTNHLKELSRKVLKVNTEEEVLNYLTDAFLSYFNCDVIAIGTFEGAQLVLNSSEQAAKKLSKLFPHPTKDINPLLLKTSMTKANNDLSKDSEIKQFFDSHNYANWFTVPLAEEGVAYGLVIVGYEDDTVLYDEMREDFDELGNYIAIVLNLINRNKSRQQSLVDMHTLAIHLDSKQNMEKLVSKVIDASGRETHSHFAAVYLLNDDKDSLIMQSPTYGYAKKESIISLDSDNLLTTYFPNVEQVGDHSITIPLTVDMEMIGVLYTEKDSEHIYTGSDLVQLQMFANYFSVTYENMQLISKEKKQKENLEYIIKVQQEMIKYTIENDGFSEINEKLGKLLQGSVILYDRFFNLIDYYAHDNQVFSKDSVIKAGNKVRKSRTAKQVTFDLLIEDTYLFNGMPISDGTETHAYIALTPAEDMDTGLMAILINMIKNIYSLQFIKQKIALTAQEEVKGSFVDRLLKETVEGKQELLDYANLFNWDLYKPYRVSVLKIDFSKNISTNVIDEKARKNLEFDYMRELVTNYNRQVITTIIQEQLIIFTPVTQELSQKYWQKQQAYLNRLMEENEFKIEFVIGIGGIAETPEQYFENYEKAEQAANILLQNSSTSTYAFFDELGSYTVLNWVKDNPVSEVFVSSYLKKLYLLSDNHNVDLFSTLRVYLENNGNISATANELYIHRSSLNYRLDKIKDSLEIDIDSSNERFNLMLAYKLFDIHGSKLFSD